MAPPPLISRNRSPLGLSLMVSYSSRSDLSNSAGESCRRSLGDSSSSSMSKSSRLSRSATTRSRNCFGSTVNMVRLRSCESTQALRSPIRLLPLFSRSSAESFVRNERNRSRVFRSVEAKAFLVPSSSTKGGREIWNNVRLRDVCSRFVTPSRTRSPPLLLPVRREQQQMPLLLRR